MPINWIGYRRVSNLIFAIYNLDLSLFFFSFKFSVTDTGGAFRQITSTFWNQIYSDEKYFTDEIIDASQESFVLGKLLFWTLLHRGLWPQWLHKLHIQYLIDEKIDVVNILKQYNPIVYKLYHHLMSSNSNLKNSLQNWICNREVNVSLI